MSGCLTALNINNVISCVMCSSVLNLIAVNNSCVCTAGYYFSSNDVCKEICGDGEAMADDCDDGNNVNGDGCDSVCKLEVDFACNILVKPSLCTSELLIGFRMVSIMKN